MCIRRSWAFVCTSFCLSSGRILLRQVQHFSLFVCRALPFFSHIVRCWRPLRKSNRATTSYSILHYIYIRTYVSIRQYIITSKRWRHIVSRLDASRSRLPLSPFRFEIDFLILISLSPPRSSFFFAPSLSGASKIKRWNKIQNRKKKERNEPFGISFCYAFAGLMLIGRVVTIRPSSIIGGVQRVSISRRVNRSFQFLFYIHSTLL